MSGMLTRLGLCVMWLLQRLPFPALVSVGRGLGRLLYWFGRERRHVALTNLRLCFPDLPEVERVGIARRLFGFIARSFLERGLLWWAPEARLRQLIRLEGKQHLDTARAERPVLLLVPHFAGLDAAARELPQERENRGRTALSDQVAATIFDDCRDDPDGLAHGRLGARSIRR